MVFKTNKSPFYYARFRKWDETQKVWKWTQVSTRKTIKREAEIVAKKYAEIATVAQNIAGSVSDKDFYRSLLNQILQAAGIDFPDKPSHLKICDLLEEYIKSKEYSATKATIKTYNTHKNAFVEWLAIQGRSDESIDWLDLEKCNRYYFYRLDTDAPKTANEKIRFLKRVWDKAILLEKVKSNPFEMVELVSKGEVLHRMPFSLNEIQSIISFLSQGSPRYREWMRAVIIGIQSGARIEDAISMKTDCLNDNILRYEQSKTGKYIECPIVVEKWREELGKVKTERFCETLYIELSSIGNAKLSSEFTEIVALRLLAKVFLRFSE